MMLALSLAQGIVPFVQWSANGTADAGGGRVARLVSDILRPSEADAMLGVIAAMVADKSHLDSVDALPGESALPLRVERGPRTPPSLRSASPTVPRSFGGRACSLDHVLPPASCQPL